MKELSGRGKQITLGADGELHQRLEDPAYTKDAIFCVHCSTANLPGALFCNHCGRSLIEQQFETPFSQDSDWTKRKNDEVRKPKLATYDPSKYNLVEKRPTESDKVVGLIVAGIVGTAILQHLPPIFAILIVGGVFVVAALWASYYFGGRWG